MLVLMQLNCTPRDKEKNQESTAVNERSRYASKFSYQDIDNFNKAHSMLNPESDSVVVLQTEYLDKGSLGLKEFTEKFSVDAKYLSEDIHEYPNFYASLVDLKERLVEKEPTIAAMFDRLKELYPEAPIPTIYYLVGGLRAGGNGGDGNYILIGAEVYSVKPTTDWSEFSKNARLYDPSGIPHIVAHETTHTLQEAVQGSEAYVSIYTDDAKGTLLAYSVREGGADYFAKLISGNHINPEAHAYGDQNEQELWQLFKKEMHSTELGDWFFYAPKVHIGWPRDLGYYMGYKITEAYFQNAVSQEEAVKALLSSEDYLQFFKDSGYAQKFKE